MRAVVGDEAMRIVSDDTVGKDPNGLGEETLLIAGAVKLAKRASSKQWKDQVLKFHAIQRGMGPAALLALIGITTTVEAHMQAHCP